MDRSRTTAVVSWMYYYFLAQYSVCSEKEALTYITTVTSNQTSSYTDTVCSFSLSQGTKWDFNKVKKGKEMIILTLLTSNELEFPDSIYRPSSWVLVLEGPGKRFLLLDEDFIQKSAYTLSFSVAHVTVIVNQSPENCLANRSSVNIENSIRSFILDKLVITDDETELEFEVCNDHYFDDGTGYGEITHVCCRKNSTGFNCELYDNDKYVTILNTIVLTVTCVLSTFFPFLIRNSYFRKQVVTIYRLEIKGRALRKVLVQKNRDEIFINSHHISNRFDNLKHQFEHLNSGAPYLGQVRSIYLRVKGNRIIRDSGESPICFTTLLWDIKSVSPSFQKILRGSRVLNFVHTAILKLVILLILTSPLTCVYFFYAVTIRELLEYEQSVADGRRIISSSRFIHNTIVISTWVTGIVSIVMYLLSITVPERDLQHANAVILSCLEGTKKLSISERFDPLSKITSVWKSLLVGPSCHWKKILERLCAVLVFPALLLLYAVLLLSILHSFFNFIFRLIYGFSQSTQRKGKSRDPTGPEFQLTYMCKVYGFSWTITLIMYSCVFCFLCVPFYLRSTVYTLLGFLLNFDNVLKYFTIVSLIIFVIYDGTYHVAGWYRKYFKFVCEKLYERVAKEMNGIAREIYDMNDKEKQKSANKVKHEIIMVSPDAMTDDDYDDLEFRESGDGHIKLRTTRALLFIDISHKKCYTSISTGLFEKMVKLPHALCPGEARVLYMKKLAQFIITTVTVLNLVFVVFFLVDQSDNYTTDGVQTLAAIGSGFLLFAIRRFIFMERSKNFEEGNKEMLTHLSHQRFQDCQEDWTVVDLDIADITEEKVNNNDRCIGKKALPHSSVTIAAKTM